MKITRRLLGTIAAPSVPAGIVLAGAAVSAAPQALAQGSEARCSTVAMPNTKAATDAPDLMKRAGQVAALGKRAPSSDSTAAMACR